VDKVAELAEIDRKLGELSKRHSTAIAHEDWAEVVRIQAEIDPLQGRKDELRDTG
jgi:hypothetical protein